MEEHGGPPPLPEDAGQPVGFVGSPVFHADDLNHASLGATAAHEEDHSAQRATSAPMSDASFELGR